MRISVFGLGYVGCVSAACLAKEGHTVVGVDVNVDKVDAFRMGLSPIAEPGLAAIIADYVASGFLTAVTDAHQAVQETDLSLICVGTPSGTNGELDLRFVERVCEEIGASLARKETYHVVALRSTVLPGTTEHIVIPTLQKNSCKCAGVDFGVAFNPEFLREGSAIADFYQPARTVIGSIDRSSGDLVASAYAGIEAPLVFTDLPTAEMVKYTDNAFHALKIAFTNEIATLCQAEDIDSHEVMDIFCLDTKLNLSRTYLKPGNAFGGSCLPKDLRALLHRLRSRDVAAPVIQAILSSNEIQKQRGFELVSSFGRKAIGILGLSFKSGTDDLRESPTIDLIESLLGKGYTICVYDRNVVLDSLVGTNRQYLEQHLPHIAQLIRSSMEEVLAEAEVIVITTNEPAFATVPAHLGTKQILVDFVRIGPDLKQALPDRYVGLAW